MSKTTDNTGRSSKKARWRIPDLIDLEYFLYRDTGTENGEGPDPLVPGARDIYLSRLGHLRDDGSLSARRRLIKGWLDIRRQGENGSTPGAIYREIGRISLMAAIMLGLFSGIGLAMSLLAYSGTRPLNVSVFMGTAVFTQILLLLFLASLFCFRAVSRSPVRNSVLAQLAGRMLTAALLKAKGHAMKAAGGQTREALAAAAGLFRGRRRVYGSLFFWPVFILLQTFAFCFNAGLLGATLVKLAGADVAFGWQSTFQVSSGVVFKIVEILSLPWRGFLPSAISHPSLVQIEGSRMILKEGIYHLATRDLVSWWPFLCLSVLFYGLLPRLVLLLSGVFTQRRLLSRLRFDHGDCERLVRSMIRPVMQTTGAPAAVQDVKAADSGKEMSGTKAAASYDERMMFTALVPEDIFDACDGLEDAVAGSLGIRVKDRKKFGAGLKEDRALLDVLEKIPEEKNSGGVLVLQEAWQPPIRETLSFLKELRRRLGERVGIIVGLVGKPEAESVFTRVRDEDWRIWKRGIDALGDPYLRVERLGVERLATHDA